MQRIETLATQISLAKSRIGSNQNPSDKNKLCLRKYLLNSRRDKKRAKKLIMYKIPENKNNDTQMRIEHDKTSRTELSGTFTRFGVKIEEFRYMLRTCRSKTMPKKSFSKR